MIKIRKIIKYFILFLIGGASYFLIENIWRGYSHVSMFVLGGLCFITIGIVRESLYGLETPLLIQQLIACLIITLLELIFGLALNIKLGLGVWDYSGLKYNFMGQISLLYSILWFFLSLPTIIIYDYIRSVLFKEKRPQYRYI